MSWYVPAKGALDLLAAAVLIVLLAPLIALTMLVVKLTSRGPALYSQTRLGTAGRPFTIYKIRTMVQDSESKTGPCWSTAGDPRITPLGIFLRRSHLDELPQLYNILRGEMSLVGPRPERPEFVVQLERVIPRYRERLAIRPGVTGLAQVRLPSDSDLTSVQRKQLYDLHYIAELSFGLDLRILLCTALGLVGIPHAISARVFRLPGPLTSTSLEGAATPAPTDSAEIPVPVEVEGVPQLHIV